VSERAFGRRRPWSVGVEEEIMLLDAETLELVPASSDLLDEAGALEVPGSLKLELFASVLELTTDPCESADDAAESLRGLRSSAQKAGARLGLRLAAAGTHPTALPADQEIADDPRYRAFVDYAGISAKRQGVNGLHVHVEMPSADACFAALEGALPWLPLVLALSANSPYLAGTRTGLASNRAEVLAQLPRSGAPPAFGSFEGWERFIARFVAAGLAEDYTRFWWDVRPHPRFGTLEVRMPDQPTALERTAAFVALVQTLCAHFAGVSDGVPADRGVYQQNRWAALRFGADAELLHPTEDRTASVAQLAQELLERVAPTAAALGTGEAIGVFETVEPEGVRQLEVGRARGLQAVSADVVERTLVS
jgi:glutamate---cysteine ligase / carboxylate-amine ligase